MAEIPVKISATIVDEWGIEASTCYYANANDGQTIAALGLEVAAFLTTLDAATDGQIKSSRVTILPVLPTALKSTAASGSRVEQTGLLGFNPTQNKRRYSVTIPALSNGGTVLSGDRMTLGSGPLAALITLLTTVGTVLTWTNEHNQAIHDFIDAIVAFHKMRKQLQRSSFEV